MTMHLVHPSLSLNGKKKGKKKFRNAQAAQKARELDNSWANLLKQHGIEQEERRRKKALASEVLKPSTSTFYRRETPKIASLPFTGAPCVRAPDKVYTGTKMLGIGTMHRSNAVPIFSDEEAVNIANMRR
jgi:hypothetical protein